MTSLLIMYYRCLDNYFDAIRRLTIFIIVLSNIMEMLPIPSVLNCSACKLSLTSEVQLVLCDPCGMATHTYTCMYMCSNKTHMLNAMPYIYCYFFKVLNFRGLDLD